MRDDPTSREQDCSREDRAVGWRPLGRFVFGGLDAETRDARWGRALGIFWASIWLIWLVVPLITAWQKRSIVGLLAVVAFAAVYMWHFSLRGWVFSGAEHDLPFAGAGHRTLRGGASLAASAMRFLLMLVISGIAIAALGQSGATCLVFTAIAAMWSFPVRIAFTAAIAVAFGYVVLWQHLSDWTPDYGSLFGMGFGVLAVTAGRISGERQRALNISRRENASLAVQAERNRMARDLHDILGHSLTVITVKSELAGRLLEAGATDRARAEVADLERLSREALADVRRAVEGYREISLAGELSRAREALAAAGVRAVIPSTTDEVVGDERELFAWLVREGVTNVIRHSGASTCRIGIGAHSASVSDDGRSAAAIGRAGSPMRGNGLRGLRERAEAAGFVLTTSATGGGFTLAVTERGYPNDGGVSG